jgi:integrase
VLDQFHGRTIYFCSAGCKRSFDEAPERYVDLAGRQAAAIDAPMPRFHDARHGYATHALAAGLSAHAVAALLGHVDAALISRRYGHALPDEVAGAGEALAAFRAVRGCDRRTIGARFSFAIQSCC